MRRFWIPIAALVLLVLPLHTQAASNPLKYVPEVVIPNFAETGSTTIDGLTAANYIKAVFVYFIWVVGILAVVMITYGGIRWVAAAGNPGRINDARGTINNALIGLVIALTSYTLLYVINPDLTTLKSLNPEDVQAQTLAFQESVVKLAGEISTCQFVRSLSGAPTSVCTNSGQCSSDLNYWIDLAAQKYSTDPVLVKAVIMQESPKNASGNPQSGPGRVPESKGSSRLTSSYGLGQWTAATLLSILPHVTNDHALPAACNHTVADLRQTSGSLITPCAQWLEDNLQLQVNMVALRLADVQTTSCTSKGNTEALLGYHLGDGDANNYCAGKTLHGTTPEDLAVYIQQVEKKYSAICSASLINQAPPAGARSAE